jgi:hypothetical protein
MISHEHFYGLVIWILYINWIFRSFWFNILSWIFWLEFCLSCYYEFEYNIKPGIGLLRNLILMGFLICTLDSIMDLGADFLA